MPDVAVYDQWIGILGGPQWHVLVEGGKTTSGEWKHDA
jgi:hypothetical protein